MEDVNEQFERIRSLVEKTWEKLDPQVKGFLKGCLYRILYMPDNDPEIRGLSGRTANLDKNNTKFIVLLNLDRLKPLSDDTIIGILAHEFAHCKDMYRKKLSFRIRFNVLRFIHDYLGYKQFAYLRNEKIVDRIAISWGFEKEIESMRNECLFITSDIKIETIKNSVTEENASMKNTRLILQCQNCNQVFIGFYYWSWIFGSLLSITKDGVPLGQCKNKNPMYEEDMIKYAYCPKCRMKKLSIKSKEDMFISQFGNGIS